MLLRGVREQIDHELITGGQNEGFFEPVTPRGTGSGAVTAGKQLVDREADVAGDLSEQGRRDVAASVEGNGRHAAVGMAELLV